MKAFIYKYWRAPKQNTNIVDRIEIAYNSKTGKYITHVNNNRGAIYECLNSMGISNKDIIDPFCEMELTVKTYNKLVKLFEYKA